MVNETYECPNSLAATVDSCFALIGARQDSVADSESLHQKVYILQMTTRQMWDTQKLHNTQVSL